MKFERASVEIVSLNVNDVVTTSGGTTIPCTCDFGMPGLVL